MKKLVRQKVNGNMHISVYMGLSEGRIPPSTPLEEKLI